MEWIEGCRQRTQLFARSGPRLVATAFSALSCPCPQRVGPHRAHRISWRHPSDSTSASPVAPRPVPWEAARKLLLLRQMNAIARRSGAAPVCLVTACLVACTEQSPETRSWFQPDPEPATGGAAGAGGVHPPESRCGDGVIEGHEDCDDGNLGSRTCQSEGFASGGLRCSSACTYDTTSCSNCQNGVVDWGEECDGDDLAGLATCVDGVVSGHHVAVGAWLSPLLADNPMGTPANPVGPVRSNEWRTGRITVDRT